MKWPNSLTIIRHGESAYNVLKSQKAEDPEYVEFKKAYNRRKKDPETARRLARALVDSGKFQLNVGEHNTAMTENGQVQAQSTGRRLSERIKLPDVVLVSPYERTVHTLGYMALGWPALGDVKTITDERLREQDHGLAAIYNDWRIFQIMYPEQEQLRNQLGAYWYRYPQGENVPDMRDRIRATSDKLSRDYSGQNVLLVTHHLWMLGYRANNEHLDELGFLRIDKEEKPINCGVTIYEGYPDLGEDGRLVLETYNERLY